MKKRSTAFLACLLAVSFLAGPFGCATQFPSPTQQTFTLQNGNQFEAWSLEQQNASGFNSREVYVFDKEGKMVTKDAFAAQGWVNGATQNALGALLQAGGLVGAGAVIRPSQNYNNSGSANQGTGAVAVSGSESKSTAIIK
jgi:hypothetical protein